ncbi:MAG: nickel transporter [Burkholderiales bacterium]|nr:nickel transporter [Burkholderiales bacterium]MDE2160042.1 nickel transporter [Burkholderiales bacterium]
MHALPTDWNALAALVFLLGMRHGFDADHLAAIDGLTRLSARHRRRYARWCGALFSLGHGAVVLAIAAAVGLASEAWHPPAWLDAFGAWVSIAFLLLVGLGNLRAVLGADPAQPVALVGVKAPLLARLLPAGSAAGVAAVGAIFAVSFDTLSQTALFAATATPVGGARAALALGALFMLGMLASDGVNGWWIARLIARADQVALLASRVMGLAVAGVSLLVAALGIAGLASPAFRRWGEPRELAFGAAVVGLVGASYLGARVLAARAPRRAG